MAYHPLTNESGGDAFARNREAHKIIFDIGLLSKTGAMTPSAAEFVEKSAERLRMYDVAAEFSVKQIFWLRGVIPTVRVRVGRRRTIPKEIRFWLPLGWSWMGHTPANDGLTQRLRGLQDG